MKLYGKTFTFLIPRIQDPSQIRTIKDTALGGFRYITILQIFQTLIHDILMDMKRRILSCFLAFCMIFALLPAPAQAAGNAENAAATVKATVQHAETGQITAQIEAYMTDSANKTRTVKPCDIIFLIEQSKFMNTQNGSASSGDERAEILGAIDRLLDGMPQPTTGGEHRIAIAGYGRINNPGIGDSYDAALYHGRL